jgi:hypothetical protein
LAMPMTRPFLPCMSGIGTAIGWGSNACVAAAANGGAS